MPLAVDVQIESLPWESTRLPLPLEPEPTQPESSSSGNGTSPYPEGSPRRDFLSTASSVVMAGGLIGGYGMFAGLAGRFLFPAESLPMEWMFVGELSGISTGESFAYRSPVGQSIAITRLSAEGGSDDFIALSSVCPHLGCQVHWEAGNERFFCPCHNGAFDAAGNAIAGPPHDAGQTLARYSLKVENGLLFIQVPTTSLTSES